MTSGLRFVFGPRIDGDSWEDAVRDCEWGFVRSRSQLALERPGHNATGHRLTAWEAWHAYGREVVEEAIEHSGAVLRRTGGSLDSTILEHCAALRVSLSAAASRAGLVDDGSVFHQSHLGELPVKALGSLAFALGLDERLLSFTADCGGDRDLAWGLSQAIPSADDDAGSAVESTIAALAESLSVVRTQRRLQDWLGEPSEQGRFEWSPDYGRNAGVARRRGYDLGDQAREVLGLGTSRIDSMRDLVQGRLGIPVVSAELPSDVAVIVLSASSGSGDGTRGMVVNSTGANEDSWVRRVTLARGLGHVLFDSDDIIQGIHVTPHLVDSTVEGVPADGLDQRAYAFALSFLAPEEVVKQLAPLPVTQEAVGSVMQRFGMCESAARRRIDSCHSGEAGDIPYPWSWVQPSAVDVEAEDLFCTGSAPCEVAVSRRGKFSEAVMGCYRESLISGDTAALYLGCSAEELSEGFSSSVQ